MNALLQMKSCIRNPSWVWFADFAQGEKGRRVFLGLFEVVAAGLPCASLWLSGGGSSSGGGEVEVFLAFRLPVCSVCQ